MNASLPTAPALFDADFMRKLETLHLLARKLFRGQSQNDRTTLRRDMGLEFAGTLRTAGAFDVIGKARGATAHARQDAFCCEGRGSPMKRTAVESIGGISISPRTDYSNSTTRICGNWRLVCGKQNCKVQKSKPIIDEDEIDSALPITTAPRRRSQTSSSTTTSGTGWGERVNLP